MAESVFGKPVDNAVKEIGEQISALNSNVTQKSITSGSLLTNILALPTGSWSFIAVSPAVTDTPVSAYFVGFVIRSTLSDNQIYVQLTRPDNGSTFINTYYGEWKGWKTLTIR